MNPSKRKGTAAEVALLAWLHGHGHTEAVRNPPAGIKDVGDLTAYVECHQVACRTDRLVIEVKSWKDVAAAMREGLAELEDEKLNACTDHGVLVLKRRGVTDPGEWYAVRLVKDDPEIGQGGL